MNQLNKYIYLLLMVFSLTSAAAFSSTTQNEVPSEYAGDAAITTQVKAAILKEPTLKFAEIKVETHQGTVQLSGFLSSQSDISTVMKMTYDVAGVQSVTNDMHLK